MNYAQTVTDVTTGITLELQYVDLDRLTVVENPRFVYEGIRELSDNIEEVGALIAPIWVGFDLETLRGHCRRLALIAWRDRDPEGFERSFPGGKIPSYVAPEGTGRAILDSLKQDDNDKGEILSTAYECQRSANMIFRHGGKEGDVAVKLDRLIGRTSKRSSVESDIKDQLKKVDLALETCAEGPEREDLKEERHRLTKLNRRGQVQKLHYGFNLAKILNPLFEYTITGEVPEGYTGPIFKIEPMTTKVQTLHKAYTDDLKEKDDDGLPLYSINKLGPKTTALMAKWAKAHAEPKSKKQAKRAMSAKQLEDEIKARSSRVFRLILKMVADGEVSEDNAAYLSEMDGFLANFESCGTDVQEEMQGVAADEAKHQRELQAEAEADAN
jgi:hypothetical protein